MEALTLSACTQRPVPPWRKAEVHIDLPTGFQIERVEACDEQTPIEGVYVEGRRARIRVANHGAERQLWARIVGRARPDTGDDDGCS